MTNEKGLFAQAGLRNVRGSTIERKIMSTKTTTKRISLVAALALGFGVITGVAANAVGNDMITPTVGTAGTGVASLTATVSGATGGQVVFTFAPSTVTPVIITADANSTIVSATGANANQPTKINGTSFADGASWTPASTTDVATVTLTSSTPGTSVVTISKIDGATGVKSTVSTLTITWGVTPKATIGTTHLATGLVNCSAGTATSVTLPKAAGTGSLCITVKDQSGTPMNGVPLDVTIQGPGLVSATAGASTPGAAGTTRTASLTALQMAAASTAAIAVSSDGTSGPSTVTVSTGTTVLGTASFSFYDAPYTVSATQVLSVASTSGGTLGVSSAAPTGADSANSPAVIVTVKDKNGILIPSLGANILAVSSDPSVMSPTITSTESDGTGAGNTTKSTYNSQVTSVSNTSGKSATLTFEVLGSDGVTFVKSAPIKFTLGGSVATVTLSLDKSSYSLGSTAVAKLTAKDSSGNAAKDGILATTLSDVLTSSLGVNKTLFGASVDFIGGVATATFNAPAVTGAWTISGSTGTGPSTDKGKALTVSATVTGGNDAAIASVITKINALAVLIAKIQKKLGIK